MKDFGILVFGHTRAHMLGDLLESLKRQGAIGLVDLWIDGHQGKTDLKNKVHVTQKVADAYDVGVRRYHNGQLGFRKTMLQAMQVAANEYKHAVFLEDDCFPSRHAVEVFRRELEKLESDPTVFSVYGHPFGMAEETGSCTRFQGWGWGTTSDKLKPYLQPLIDCYSMSEQSFLDLTRSKLTPEIIARLDVTPPRQPSYTLNTFFAWDETLALLCALKGQVHKPTQSQVIFNCGMGDGSSHFTAESRFREPPFNLIHPDEVWTHF